MNQFLNNIDRQYDTVGRLSVKDKEMMTQVSMSSCNRFENSMETSRQNDGNNPMKGNLSTTPKDTSFMTEENLKKIYMPKRIKFWRHSVAKIYILGIIFFSSVSGGYIRIKKYNNYLWVLEACLILCCYVLSWFHRQYIGMIVSSSYYSRGSHYWISLHYRWYVVALIAAVILCTRSLNWCRFNAIMPWRRVWSDGERGHVPFYKLGV